jgi:copper(I)-binding protein
MQKTIQNEPERIDEGNVIIIREKAILSLLFSFLTVIIISSCTGGGKPEVEIMNVTVVPSGMMKGVASSFMRIINKGNGNDVLTGCSIKEYPSARGELHDFIDGRMTRVEEVKIPARETTELKRGGLHAMFFKIPEKPKETVTLVMHFEKTGPMEVMASIASSK